LTIFSRRRPVKQMSTEIIVKKQSNTIPPLAVVGFISFKVRPIEKHLLSGRIGFL
jgi:hypothetical protein